MAQSRAQACSPADFKLQMARRSLLLAGLVAVWMLAIALRLYDLQVIQYVQLEGRAEREQERTVEIAPQRGTIYDRNLHPLAMSLPASSIYAVPDQLGDPELAAKLLAPILNLDATDLAVRFKTNHTFCWIKRKVSAAEAARVQDLRLKGIYFEQESRRFYPKGDLAAQVLGYVGMDDRGLGGIEYSMDSEIRGQPGRILVVDDARHQSFGSTEWKGKPGKNVVLTIDQNIQYFAESALDHAVKKFHAAGGTAIVENPYTGEILAMANAPTFDPNDYSATPPQNRIDRGVSWVYEPGSTFKVVTVSSALQDGLAKPTELIDCQMGRLLLGGRIIHDDEGTIPHERQGPLTLSQVIAYSSDVGAAKVALRLGQTRFYDGILKFGLDAKTNVGLPGEDQGLLEPPDRWSGVKIGEIAFGQGIGVTPLQMADVFSTIANGGILIQPRIVRETFWGDEHQPMPPSSGRRVISEKTAEQMKQMLAGVVEFGTGTNAQLNGYTSAGKTGTAEKVNAFGRYSHRQYVASFIGFAPVEKPAVTILVVVDTPVGAIYGAEVAAPVFRSIAEQTLNYLDVPQDHPTRWLQADSRLTAATSRQKRAAAATNSALDPELAGAATMPFQLVSYSKALPATGSDTVVVSEGPKLALPDFTSLPARVVIEQCQKLGLDIKMFGTGLAVQQSPPPGSQVARGSTVRVLFAR
jgi:cell division protein FtsI (penicillin-binding protein 3)